MSITVTIEYDHDTKDLESIETSGLHAALGHIEDRFVQAKEGIVPEILQVVISIHKFTYICKLFDRKIAYEVEEAPTVEPIIEMTGKELFDIFNSQREMRINIDYDNLGYILKMMFSRTAEAIHQRYTGAG